MRNRDIKINVFLNEEEKKLLDDKCREYKLSKSDFIRKSIYNYEKSNTNKKDILNDILKLLNENINYLIIIKNQFHNWGYFESEITLEEKINSLTKEYNKILEESY